MVLLATVAVAGCAGAGKKQSAHHVSQAGGGTLSCPRPARRLHITVSCAHALKTLRVALGAEPSFVSLTWEYRGGAPSVPAWLGFSDHAHVGTFGGPLGRKTPRASRFYDGPAIVWTTARKSEPNGGASSIRTRPQRVLPGTLAAALRREGTRVRMVHANPSISRAEALVRFHVEQNVSVYSRDLWLVRLSQFGHLELAWMALSPHAVVPTEQPVSQTETTGKGFHPRPYVGPVCTFISAETGEFLRSTTVNGWKP